MDHADTDKPASVAVHPELRRILLANPTKESLHTMIEHQLFYKPSPLLEEDVQYLLPYWEQQACQGNGVITDIIDYILKSFPNIRENKPLQNNLLRIRILASTPGYFSFPPLEIQENLRKFLQTSELIADLPQMKVVSISESEIIPLESDLTHFRLTPHSLRYIENLFYPERREAILSVLAYLTKHHPLTSIRKQSYALMLSLDTPEHWGRHPFCLRLMANCFWDCKLTSVSKTDSEPLSNSSFIPTTHF